MAHLLLNIKRMKEFLKKANEHGLKLPFGHDAVSKKPSVTLLFSYITFVLAVIANLVLVYKDVFIGTITFIVFWVLATVFYLIRRLKTFKADLDDRSIELEGDNENDSKP